MKRFVLLSLLVASVHGNGYGGSAPSAPSGGYGQPQFAPAAPVMMHYQQHSAPQQYGGYSQQQSSPSSYSAPQRFAPVESVRVAFSDNHMGGGYGHQSYSAPAPVAAPVSVSYGSGSSDSGMYTGGYGGQSSESHHGSYGAPAPVETVRVSYGSGSSDAGAYGASSAAPSSSYSSAPSSSDSYSSSYSAAPTRAHVPVETVRVSFGSGASSDSSSYGAASSSSSSYGSSSSSSDAGSSSYSAPAASPSYSTSSATSYGSSSTRNNVPIVRHTQDISSSGHSYDFATGDGISHSETTSVRQGAGGYKSSGYGSSGSSGSGSEVAKHGRFSYTSPEGKKISLNYQADSQGFRAQGDHLPTPPPIPAEIAKSLRSSSGYGATKSSSY